MRIFDKYKKKIEEKRKNEIAKKVKEQFEYNQSEEYRDKYITRKEINHPYFGKLVFEIDSHGDEYGNLEYNLVEGLKDIGFGALKNSNVINFLILEDKIDDTLLWLEKVYKNSEQILNGFYEMIIKRCKEEKINLTNGNKIDQKFIEENFIIREMDVQAYDEEIDNWDEITVKFFGKLSAQNEGLLLDGRVIMISIHCKANNIKYEVCDFT